MSLPPELENIILDYYWSRRTYVQIKLIHCELRHRFLAKECLQRHLSICFQYYPFVPYYPNIDVDGEIIYDPEGYYMH